MRIKKACEYCGKEFEVIPSKAARRRFCSHSCASSARGAPKRAVICKHCGHEFEASSKWQADVEFCSRKCVDLWRSENVRGENHPSWKERVKLNCEWCDKEFAVIPSCADRGARFCSVNCVNSWKRANSKGETRECLVCGKEFYAKPQSIKRGHGKFCSRVCASHARRKTISRICNFCSKAFEAKAFQVKKGWGLYCSSKCAHEASKKPCIVRICEQCGKQFTKRESEISPEHPARFCSKHCHSASMKKIVKRECEFCKKPFETKPFTVKSGYGRFCSRGCSSRARMWQPWNEHYFDELSSGAAYILGFIVADGHLGLDGSRINICQKEPEILQRIAQRLEANVRPRSDGKYHIDISSKHAWNILTKVYEIPAGKKSNIVRIPKVLFGRTELFPHLIRGLFDGDGTVTNKVFGFTSTSSGLVDDFVRVLMLYADLPHKEKTWGKGGLREDDSEYGAFRVYWGDFLDRRQFAEYIYGPERDAYDSDLYLERKKELFDQLFIIPWQQPKWLHKQLVVMGKSFSEIASDFEDVHPKTIGVYAGKYGLGMTVRICDGCGREFECPRYLVDGGNARFCSKECYNARGKNMVSRICKYCGVGFEVWPVRVRRGHGFYCSRECACKAQSLLHNISISCKHCGKIFDIPLSWVKKRHFCSRKCVDLARAQYGHGLGIKKTSPFQQLSFSFYWESLPTRLVSMPKHNHTQEAKGR